MAAARAACVAPLAALTSAMVMAGCDGRPPPPPQPVAFSHRVHAGEEAIGCTSCHVYAERGPVAGVPSMARCQGCHKFVKEDPDRPEIAKQLAPVLKAIADGATIAWVRVHRLPDHVYFTHERHVLAGVACQECHGPVERMDVVRQVAPLTMGWCLECHHRKQREQPGRLPRLTQCITCHK